MCNGPGRLLLPYGQFTFRELSPKVTEGLYLLISYFFKDNKVCALILRAPTQCSPHPPPIGGPPSPLEKAFWGASSVCSRGGSSLCKRKRCFLRLPPGGGCQRMLTGGASVPNNSLSYTIETADFIRAEAVADHGTLFASARGLLPPPNGGPPSSRRKAWSDGCRHVRGKPSP